MNSLLNLKKGAFMRIQVSGEDYLKGILVLEKKNGTVRSVDLARYQQVSKASVSNALAVLREKELVTMDEKLYIHLTEQGRNVAQSMYDRHCFFRDHLISIGVDEKTAAEDACKLEHAISDVSFQKLKEALDK